jgi:predicted phosphodiesterase
MRLAILSDIHGNPLALDAVLADIHRRGPVDTYWLLGDFAALGYDPVGVLERVTTLPNAYYIRGNTDRYTVTGERPGPSLQQVQAEPKLLPKVIELARNFAWTQGYVSGGGWLDWLERLPLDVTATLPDGTKVLGVHAAPGTDDGVGIHPGLSDAELYDLLAPTGAQLVFVGHTHVSLDRTVKGIRVVNLGSVSNPATPDLRASYVLLEATEKGYHLELRRVEYDREAVIEAVRRVKHPAAEFIANYFLGKQISPLYKQEKS